MRVTSGLTHLAVLALSPVSVLFGYVTATDQTRFDIMLSVRFARAYSCSPRVLSTTMMCSYLAAAIDATSGLCRGPQAYTLAHTGLSPKNKEFILKMNIFVTQM